MKTEEVLEQAQELVKQLRGVTTAARSACTTPRGRSEVRELGRRHDGQEVVEGVAEPTHANQIKVGGRGGGVRAGPQPALYQSVRGGGSTPAAVLPVPGSVRGIAPLDAQLGMDGCFGYSPLMTLLICALGADEVVPGGGREAGAAAGIQRKCDGGAADHREDGERIPEASLIEAARRDRPCPLMVVEVDGTMSPQITELEGVTGPCEPARSDLSPGVQPDSNRAAGREEDHRPLDGRALRTTQGIAE